MTSGKKWKIRFFTINAHERMRMKIVQKVSKVITSFGTFEVKVTQVKHVGLRKKVLVKR